MKPFKFFQKVDSISLPIARRLEVRTIANELVPVQPMRQPTYGVTYLTTEEMEEVWRRRIE